MEDPFELDQQSMDGKLHLLQDNFDRWRRIKSGAADGLASAEELADAEDEFNWLTNEIQKSVKSIGWDLDDLDETLRRMSEHRQQDESAPARALYIKNSRDLLATIDGEVRTGAAKFADAGDDEALRETAGGRPQQQPQQQSIGSGEVTMSASTERLVESLFQQDEEDDDDVELLIREDEGGRARRQFSIAVGDVQETPMRRLWRRHRPALSFVGLVLLLLLVILIISLSSRGRQSAAVAPGTTTAARSGR